MDVLCLQSDDRQSNHLRRQGRRNARKVDIPALLRFRLGLRKFPALKEGQN